jgi:site-specific recombinase XerD
VKVVSRLIDPGDIRWERYPTIASDPIARKWLESQVLLGLAKNTVEAYAHSVQDFMEYCARTDVNAQLATRNELARYVGDLRRGSLQYPADGVARQRAIMGAFLANKLLGIKVNL